MNTPPQYPRLATGSCCRAPEGRKDTSACWSPNAPMVASSSIPAFPRPGRSRWSKTS